MVDISTSLHPYSNALCKVRSTKICISHIYYICFSPFITCVIIIGDYVNDFYEQYSLSSVLTADTRRCVNVGLTLAQRRIRWANVKPTLLRRLVSAVFVVNMVRCFMWNRCGNQSHHK